VKFADIQHTDYTVSDFVSWQRGGTLALSPSFQRRPVWSRGAKSLLIDTVVRGLPMPVIFLRNLPADRKSFEPSREVVDGQQRVRTVLSFIAPDLLDDFVADRDAFTVQRNHNRELAGKPFTQLDPDIQQRILDYQFSVHAFPSDTDDREILQIFARMNATGVKLNAQELRNAEFFGEFKTLMYELAAEQLENWREWGVFSERDIARMQEVEATSEFALMMLSGVGKREQTAINAAYKRYDEDFPEGRQVARRYHTVMQTIDDRIDVRMTPFRRKALFYSLFAALYDLQYGIGSDLSSARLASVPRENITWLHEAAERIEDDLAPDEVMEATQRRTTDAGSRLAVIDYLTHPQ
jgi:hypothetical protein